MHYTAPVILKRLLLGAKAFWPHMLALFLLNLTVAPLALLGPVPLKIVVDSLFGNAPLPGFLLPFIPAGFDHSFNKVLGVAIALVLLTAVLYQAHSWVSWVLKAYTGEKLVLAFRSNLFQHVQRLSLLYHDRKGSSDALYRIQYDTSGIRSLLIDGLSPIIASLFTVVAMLYVMFLINWRFALISLAIIPPLVVLTRISSARLLKSWDTVKEKESAAMSIIHEVLASLRVVKAFGQEERENNRFLEQSKEAVKGQLAVAKIGGGFYALVGILIAAGTAAFLYIGALHVQSGAITLGELIIVMAYLAQLFGPLEALTKSINDIQASLAGAGRMFTLLDNTIDVPEKPDARPVNRASGSVQFEQLSFAYPDRATPALNNISFRVRPGQRVGVWGRTGAGKSTLVNLLTRLYDPQSGTIRIDGTDIRAFKVADYRQLFGIVLQEPILFSTTIAENIAYGRPGATMPAIMRAAQAANAHEFILRCANGYDTVVGERGMQLSGGERQRISLARAFIRDAPFLILDEPTSAVDVGTEAQIMEAIDRLMEGRTTFLITHRLDTLANCDLLLHLDRGRLIEVLNKSEFSAERLETKLKPVKNKNA